MSDIPLLSAQKLTCIRQDRILFEHLDLDVFAGDIIQVEGPNGAGKSSLLRILAGLSHPYEGRVCYQGEDIHVEREAYLADLCFLGHKAGVKGELTAQENLGFNLALQGSDPLAAESALEQVHLAGFEDSPATQLSAGQHRRVSLARLWQTQSRIWILDEPFTAIDKSGVMKLEALLLEHADNGGCVILTTHQDLLLAADRVKSLPLDYNWF